MRTLVHTTLVTHSTPTLALALALAPTFGTAEAPRRPSIADVPCPAPADIGATIGFPVKTVMAMSDRCMYELAGQYKGAFVTLTYQPATRAPDVYADIKQHVKVKGVNAQPDPVKLGEGGWGYTSLGKKEAAAVARGQLYHVELDYDLFESLKLPEEAAVRVIELAMRSAPAAGLAASSLDACTLATNAEVSEIAEEKPEFAKYWPAPETSFGGAHCDYGGGSIRCTRERRPLPTSSPPSRRSRPRRRRGCRCMAWGRTRFS